MLTLNSQSFSCKQKWLKYHSQLKNEKTYEINSRKNYLMWLKQDKIQYPMTIKEVESALKKTPQIKYQNKMIL